MGAKRLCAVRPLPTDGSFRVNIAPDPAAPWPTALLISAVALLVGGCGSQSAGTEDATVDARAVNATIVKDFDPFVEARDGRLVITSPIGQKAVKCDHSLAAANGTYKCYRGNQFEDACFAFPSGERRVVCVSSPWATRGLRLRVVGFPKHADYVGDRPWALELADGTRCTFVASLTLMRTKGQRLNYTCSGPRGEHIDTALWAFPDRSRAVWTMLATFDRSAEGRFRRVKIAVAYY